MIGDWSLILQERVTSRSKIIIKYKEKEQRGRFGEIDEKILREEYTLDWSQSKVFLVLSYELLHFITSTAYNCIKKYLKLGPHG